LNRFSQIAFCTVFLLIAVFRFPSSDLRISYQVLAEAGAMLLLCAMIWEINPWVALFGVLVVFSTHFPKYTESSYYAGSAAMVGIIWYYAALKMVDSDAILDVMLIIAMANVFFMLLQVANMDPIFASIKHEETKAVGLMCNRNETAALMAFCLPAAFRGKRLWFTIPIAVGLVLAMSTGGALAAVAAVIVWSSLKIDGVKIFPIWIGVLCLFLAFLAFVDTPGIDARLKIWSRGWDIFTERPIIGWGLGHWKMVYNVGLKKPVMTSHNDVFQGIFEMGIPFTMVLIGYVISILRKLRREMAVVAAGVAAVSVNSLVNFPFHIATTAIIAVAWLAMFEVKYQETQGGS